jgi:hypothetical protein
MIAAFGLLFFGGKKRSPEFGVGGKTERTLRGNYADDGVGLAIEFDRLADGVWIGGEVFLPEFVAEDDGAIAGLHVGGGEHAAVQRADSENREEIFGDFRRFEALRFGAAFGGDLLRGVSMDSDGGEGSGRTANVGDIGKRDAEIGKVEEGAPSVDVDEFVGTREWERAEEDGVDDGKDGGVGADTEGESEDGNSGEGGGFSEEAEGEAGVVEERFYERERLLVVDELLGLFEAAEFEEGLAAGFFGGHAFGEVAVDVELEVGGEFGVEVAVGFCEEIFQAEERGAEVHG